MTEEQNAAQPGGPQQKDSGPEICCLRLPAWLRLFLQVWTIQVDSLKQDKNNFKNSFKERENKHLGKLAGIGKEGG